MQDIAIDVVCAQMLQRARHRLHNLFRQRRCWIVRQAMILARPIGKLRLQEKVGTRDDAIAIGRRQPFPDSGLVIMPPLVGGVDSAETRAQRRFYQRGGAVFLPGCSVQEIEQDYFFGSANTMYDPGAGVPPRAR